MVTDAFNPGTREAEADKNLCRSKASLICRVSSSTFRIMQKSPVSNKQINEYEFEIYLLTMPNKLIITFKILILCLTYALFLEL